MLAPEEDSLLSIEQESNKDFLIGRHVHYAAYVKLTFEGVKLALLEPHLTIILANTANME